MKKIPTLFKREFEGHNIINIYPEVTSGLEEVFQNGVATVKWDGSCCAVINGVFYKRYDAKRGKPVPEGAIICQEPDTVTGHQPCWVKCDRNNPSDKWFWVAYDCTSMTSLPDGTYEAVGRHFNGNPYHSECDVLIKHGRSIVEVERTFEGIKTYLKNNLIEGLVFWYNGEPRAKIKRSDFGFVWGGNKI